MPPAAPKSGLASFLIARGIVKDESQANIILIAFSVICLAASAYIAF